MTDKPKNAFANASKKRSEDQAQLKMENGLSESKVPSKRKVRLDLTVPADTKERLVRYAEAKGLSASVVVQMLINKSCRL